jgi:hypothetical protein
VTETWHAAWYDALYGDDPSTDNIFGREDLAERRAPLLHAFLGHGGRLADFAAMRDDGQDEDAALRRLMAVIDKALANLP